MARALRAPAGGIRSLRRLLREHGEAVEGDLRVHYGARLRDLYLNDPQGRPLMTWRELGVYVRRMPPDSATRTALREGVPEPTPEAVLLADIFDMLQYVDWHVQASGATKTSELPKPPKPYPRWWDTSRSRKKNSAERVARIEDARRRKRAREQAIRDGRIA